MKVLKWLDKHFEEALLIIALILISCVFLLQVIIRNVSFIPALKWAEEFCRFCWIWSVFLSLPYTISHGNMLRVAVLLDVLPQKARKVLNLFVDLIVTATMAFLGYWSIPTIEKIQSSGQLSPAMLWPMWLVASVMVLGFFLGTLRGIQKFIEHIRTFNEDELSTIEQTMKEAAEEAAAVKREEGTD